MKIEELFSVRGKVALVTGGSRGLGEMIARGYVENSAKVYITARGAEVCDALAKELSQFGECISIPADLSRMEENRSSFQRVAQAREETRHSGQQCRGKLGRPLEEFPEKGWRTA